MQGRSGLPGAKGATGVPGAQVCVGMVRVTVIGHTHMAKQHRQCCRDQVKYT